MYVSVESSNTSPVLPIALLPPLGVSFKGGVVLNAPPLRLYVYVSKLVRLRGNGSTVGAQCYACSRTAADSGRCDHRNNGLRRNDKLDRDRITNT